MKDELPLLAQRLKHLSKAPNPAAAQWKTAVLTRQRFNVINHFPQVITVQKKSPLNQLVWLTEILARGALRHIVSHFPFVLSKLTYLQPTVPLGMSKSLSVCTSIDVAVSIVTHYTALLLYLDLNSLITMHYFFTACHYLP